MKTLKSTSILTGILLICFRLSAQDPGKMEKLFSKIKQEVRCCAVPFANDRELKVTDISFGKNGLVELVYNEDRQPELFNLFELNKSFDAPLGIQLYQTISFIQFHISEERTRVIRFSSHDKAKEIYSAFMALYNEGREYYLPGYPLDMNQTVDSINMMLERYTEYKPRLRLKKDGRALISLPDSSGFPFNFKELISSGYTDGFEVRGISMRFYAPGSHVENNWINFNTSQGKVAFIKFGSMDDKILQQIHNLFIHLSGLLIDKEVGS